MSQDNDELQGTTQMINCISQTAKHFYPKAVARHPHNKEIVRPFVENKFDWHTGIRTAEHGGKRTLLWQTGAARHQSQIVGIDRDDLLNHAGLVLDVIEKRGKVPIAVIQPEEGGIAIRWLWSRRTQCGRTGALDD